MNRGEYKTAGNAVVRIVFVGISLVLQVIWLLLLILRLNEYSALVSLISSVLALLLVLRLYSQQTNAAMKMPWIMLILAFPVMGMSLFLLTEVLGNVSGSGKRLKTVRSELRQQLPGDTAAQDELQRSAPEAAGQFRYAGRLG